MVMHTLAEEAATTLAAQLRDRPLEATLEIAPFTAVMGIHTGSGLLGMAWEAER